MTLPPKKDWIDAEEKTSEGREKETKRAKQTRKKRAENSRRDTRQNKQTNRRTKERCWTLFLVLPQVSEKLDGILMAGFRDRSKRRASLPANGRRSSNASACSTTCKPSPSTSHFPPPPTDTSVSNDLFHYACILVLTRGWQTGGIHIGRTWYDIRVYVWSTAV